MRSLGETILRACANFSYRRPWVVLGVSLVLTIAASYASTFLTVNTSTENILSPTLPFRQHDTAYKASFPKEELAVIVVDGKTSAQADAAAADIARRLRDDRRGIERVDVAGDSPYFRKFGLLLLPPAQLQQVGNQIVQAGPALSGLAADPSLRALAQLMGLVRTSAGAQLAGAELPKMLNEFATVTQAQAEGRAASVNWSGLFDTGEDPRGTRRIVLAKPILDDTSLNRAGPAIDAIRGAAAATEQAYPGSTIRITGDPVLRQQELNDAFSGALYASVLSFILVALSLFIGIRSGRLIAALLITLVIGSIWTTGLAALAVGRLNLISVTFVVLFFGLGVDFGTHLALRYVEEARTGMPAKEALTRSMLGEAGAIFLSALCAALAFLSFVPTAYLGLAEFGIISALGMVVAVVVTFTLQPALMALMPPRKLKTAAAEIGIGRAIKRHYRGILVIAAIITAGSAYFAVDARLDANPLNLQNPNTEPVETYHDLAGDPQTSPYAAYVLAPDLAAARALEPKLAAVTGVAGVRTIESFLPSDQPAKLQVLAEIRDRLGPGFFEGQPAEPPPDEAGLRQSFTALRTAVNALATVQPATSTSEAAGRWVAALDAFAKARGTEPPAVQALTQALLGGVQPLVATLREALSVETPVTIADIPEDIRKEWIGRDGKVKIEVMPAQDLRNQQLLEGFAKRVSAVAPQATGVPDIVTGAGEAITRSFVEAIAYTTVAIAFVVFILRRRIGDVLLVLAPLAVAALWTVAGSALLDMPFNFANIIVIPLLIGLGVAGSVHIVFRASEVNNGGHGVSEKGGVLDTSTPLAVLVAQLNTVAAFATLAVSDHRGLYSMGLLLGLSILFVLIVCLVVLPAAMIAIEHWRARHQGVANT